MPPVRFFDMDSKLHDLSRSGQTLLVDTELRVICPDREADHWAPTGRPSLGGLFSFRGSDSGKYLPKHADVLHFVGSYRYMPAFGNT